MSLRRLRLPALLLAGSLVLGGCAYDNYGYGRSRSYASVSYGSGGCDPYYYDCYGSYDPWYGWYGNYYYPGWGVYVYDSYRRPHRWNDNQRRYWNDRRSRWEGRDWNDRRWERWDRWERRDDRNWRDDRRWRDRDDRGGDGRRWRGRRG